MADRGDIPVMAEFFGRTLGFEDAGKEQLIELAGQARRLVLNKGEYVFRQGDEAVEAHVVETGRVKVFKTSNAGNTFTALIAGPGYTLNAIACVAPQPRFFSARAMEKSTVLAVPAAAFNDFVIHSPRVAQSILTIMGQLQLSAFNRIMDLLEESVEQRILNILTRLAEGKGPDLVLTNADLADLAGTTRESTTRVLGRLDEAGLISRGRGRIRINDLDRLQEMAGDRFFLI